MNIEKAAIEAVSECSQSLFNHLYFYTNLQSLLQMNNWVSVISLLLIDYLASN